MDADAFYDPYRGITETYALMECDQCKAETEHLMRKQWGAWSGVCGDCGNELELDDDEGEPCSTVRGEETPDEPGGGAPMSGRPATGAIVPERQRCICNDDLCLDHCRACNFSRRDLEEPCIADPDWTPDDDDLARREARVQQNTCGHGVARGRCNECETSQSNEETA